MKFLKGLIIVVLILIALVVILGLIFPRAYHVERSAVIDACPGVVHSQFANFSNWPTWSPWSEKDSTIQGSYEGEDGSVGSKYSWVGNPEISGTGSMTMTEVTDSIIRYDLSFVIPFESSSSGYVTFESVEGGTKVTWADEGDIPFPMNAIAGLFMDFDAMIGADFERGLERVGEKVNGMKSYEVSYRDSPEMHYIGKRFTMHVDSISSALYSQTYGELSMYMMQNGANFAAQPIAVFHSYDNGMAEFEIAIPVDAELAATGEITVGTIPAGRDAYGVHFGAYEETGSMWDNMERYMSCSQIDLRYSPYEQYITDPSTEPDPSKWQTYVVYPIAE